MKLVVNGCAGRMGQTLVRLIAEDERLTLVGALENANSPALNEDAGKLAGLDALGVKVTDNALNVMKDADGVIDFSDPSASAALSALAAQTRIVHVIGTTGFTADQEAEIEAAARHAVIVKSGNMSLGINLLANLAKQATASLDASWDIEILDMHHRHKVDAPSGTALMLAEAAAEGRGVSLDEVADRGREGLTGPREHGAIGIAALRGGSVVGDHQLILAGPNERLVLSHHAESRDIFAQGALQAALWGGDKSPGLYAMSDVLGL